MAVTTAIGQAAEKNVAKHLTKNGYKIIARNWRRPRCELDIIAQKDDVVYFVEVKYRLNATQGEGFDYITPKKQKQMLFGARLWCQEASYDGDFRLLAASVSGGELDKIELLEI